MTAPRDFGGYHKPLPDAIVPDASTPGEQGVRGDKNAQYTPTGWACRSLVSNDGQYHVSFPFRLGAFNNGGMVLDSLDPPLIGDYQKSRPTVTKVLTGERWVTGLSPVPMFSWGSAPTTDYPSGPSIHPIGPSSFIFLGPPKLDQRDDWIPSRFWGPLDDVPFSTNYSPSVGFTSTRDTWIFNAVTRSWSAGPTMPDFAVNAIAVGIAGGGLALFRQVTSQETPGFGTHVTREVYYQDEQGKIWYWTPQLAADSTPASQVMYLSGPNASWTYESSPLPTNATGSYQNGIGNTLIWGKRTLVSYYRSDTDKGWLIREEDGTWSLASFAKDTLYFGSRVPLDIRAVDPSRDRALVIGMDASNQPSVVDWSYVTTGSGVRFDVPTSAPLQAPDLNDFSQFIGNFLKGFAKDGRLWGRMPAMYASSEDSTFYAGHADFGWDFEKNEGVVSWVKKQPTTEDGALMSEYDEFGSSVDTVAGAPLPSSGYPLAAAPKSYFAVYQRSLTGPVYPPVRSGFLGGYFDGEMPAYVPDVVPPDPEPEPAPLALSSAQLGAAASGIIPV